MTLFGFDIFITRYEHFVSEFHHPRPLICIEQGPTPDDWEVEIGPWYAVVSRIRNRRDQRRDQQRGGIGQRKSA